MIVITYFTMVNGACKHISIKKTSIWRKCQISKFSFFWPKTCIVLAHIHVLCLVIAIFSVKRDLCNLELRYYTNALWILFVFQISKMTYIIYNCLVLGLLQIQVIIIVLCTYLSIKIFGLRYFDTLFRSFYQIPL